MALNTYAIVITHIVYLFFLYNNSKYVNSIRIYGHAGCNCTFSHLIGFCLKYQKLCFIIIISSFIIVRYAMLINHVSSKLLLQYID